MATTQILFIRHGETAWNRIKRIQGHIDIPLADTGLAQAQSWPRGSHATRVTVHGSTRSIRAT